MTPKVSVIMPAHNAASHIGRAVDSVREQTHQDWELLVVDDGSSDATASIVAAAASEDHRIRLLQPGRLGGPGPARNHAISVARGEYFAFLDSDDMWDTNKLSLQLAFMEERKCVLSYTGYRRLNDTNGSIVTVCPPETASFESLLCGNVIACSTAMYNARELGRVYMVSIEKGQDYGTWLKILERGLVAHGLTEPLATYRVRKGSLSSNKLESATYVWKLYRNVIQLSWPRTCLAFSHYAYGSVVSRAKERLGRSNA